MEFQVVEILEEMGFSAISSKPEKKLVDEITKILEKRFGEQVIQLIIKEISRQYKNPLEEILKNPEIIFKEFEQIFGGPTTKVISKTLENDLAKQGISIPADHSIEKIFNEISQTEIKKFVRNFQGKEHVLYLWNDQRTRDEILSEYFRYSDGSKLLVNYNHSELSDAKSIAFDELLKNKSQIIITFHKLLTEVVSSNKSSNGIRCAGNDCTMWLKHNAYNELLVVENMVNEIQENTPLSFICAYNTKKILTKEKIRELIGFHNYIILEDPFRLYAN